LILSQASLEAEYFKSSRGVSIKYSITAFAKQLNKNFLRIQRSYIVNINKITAYTKHDIEIGNIEVPIGDNYKMIIPKNLTKNVSGKT